MYYYYLPITTFVIITSSYFLVDPNGIEPMTS